MDKMSVQTLIVSGEGRIKDFAVKSVSKLKEIINDLREEERPGSYVLKVKGEGIKAIRKDLFAAVREERNRIQGEYDQMREHYEANWKSNRTDNLQKVRDAERAYSAMSKEELEDVADDYINNKLGEAMDPRLIDALSAELKGVSEEKFTLFRNVAREREYRAPWKNSEEGRELAKLEKVLENLEPGAFPVSLRDEEGKTKVVAFNIDDLMMDEEV